jgi:hypothetical protein
MSAAEQTTVGEVRFRGPIAGEMAEQLWPTVAAMLEPAIENGGNLDTAESLLENLRAGKLGLFLFTDDVTKDILASILCEVIDYPSGCVFSIAYLGGREMHRWTHLIEHFEMIAFSQGCKRIRIPGRAGWGRIFRDYKEAYRVFEKEIM